MPELPPDEFRALVAEIAGAIAVASPLAPVLESTLLRPDATEADVEALCAEALQYGFAGVCINPVWLARTVAALRGSPVLAITVVDFPLGAANATAKLHAADEALLLGADELDIVLNLGLLKSGRELEAELEIAAVASLAHSAGARLKLILETALLSHDQKVRACALGRAAGADFLKTSTGTIPNGGATPADVTLLRAHAAPAMGVKASGGIRTPAQARTLLAAGATRLGTSHARALVTMEAEARS